MIKTLRITTIIAAALAVVVLALPVVFGGRRDKDMQGFLNSASVVERFKQAAGGSAHTTSAQDSPLVKQAQAFARFLNPPRPRRPIPHTPIGPPRPKTPVAPKFGLVGTSYYAANPELSLAFINEPGKGLRWVRQGSQIGHVAIEQVKDGLIVLRDGQRTFEMTVPPPPKTTLLDTGPATSSVPGRPASPQATVTTTAKAPTTAATSRPRMPGVSTEQNALIERFMKSLQAGSRSGKMDSKRIEELFSNLGSMRVGPDEAKELRDLPRRLTPAAKDPNRTRSRKVEMPQSIRKSRISPPKR